MTEEMTFQQVKELSIAEQVAFLKRNGIDLSVEKASPEDILARCASVFLNRKAVKVETPLAPVKKEEPKPVVTAGQELSKSVAKLVEAKAKPEPQKNAQPQVTFPRCARCAKAITGEVKAGKDGEKICAECAKKEESKMAKAGTNKKAAKAAKTAKKSVGTKTQKKGNIEGLKKAAEARKAAHGGETIQSFCVRRIKEAKTKTNDEIADEARKKFGSKTSAASVAWYRNKINSGEIK